MCLREVRVLGILREREEKALGGSEKRWVGRERGGKSPQAQAQGVKDEVCGTKLAAGSLFPDFAKLGSLGVRGL